MKAECMFTGEVVDISDGGECPGCDVSVDALDFWEAHDRAPEEPRTMKDRLMVKLAEVEHELAKLGQERDAIHTVLHKLERDIEWINDVAEALQHERTNIQNAIIVIERGDQQPQPEGCLCAEVFVGRHPTGSYNWNPDCPVHPWDEKLQAQADRAVEAQRLAREARQRRT